MDLSVAFIDAEDDHFTESSTTALAANSLGTKVGFVQLRCLPKKEIRFHSTKRSADESMSNTG